MSVERALWVRCTAECRHGGLASVPAPISASASWTGTSVHGITRTIQLPDGSRTVETRAAINVWVKLYQEERDRLVRAAKAAIDAGVEERQVRLAEGQAQRLAQVVRAVLTDLGHDPTDEHVRKVVRFRLVEGGKGG